MCGGGSEEIRSINIVKLIFELYAAPLSIVLFQNSSMICYLLFFSDFHSPWDQDTSDSINYFSGPSNLLKL